jgi:hypothetical protein
VRREERKRVAPERARERLDRLHDPVLAARVEHPGPELAGEVERRRIHRFGHVERRVLRQSQPLANISERSARGQGAEVKDEARAVVPQLLLDPPRDVHGRGRDLADSGLAPPASRRIRVARVGQELEPRLPLLPRAERRGDVADNSSISGVASARASVESVPRHRSSPSFRARTIARADRRAPDHVLDLAEARARFVAGIGLDVLHAGRDLREESVRRRAHRLREAGAARTGAARARRGRSSSSGLRSRAHEREQVGARAALGVDER